MRGNPIRVEIEDLGQKVDGSGTGSIIYSLLKSLLKIICLDCKSVPCDYIHTWTFLVCALLKINKGTQDRTQVV